MHLTNTEKKLYQRKGDKDMGNEPYTERNSNKRATFAPLGANNHTNHAYAENGFYATSPTAVSRLLAAGNGPRTKEIWEPCCGDGSLSKELEKHGYTVTSTDLIDRGYGEGERDFFLEEKLLAPCILTNPSYKIALPTIEKAIELGADEIWMFLKLTFLEGQKRREFFDKFPPYEVLVFSAREQCAINGDPEEFKKSSAACYAWFHWIKNYDGRPQIGWI